MPTSDIALIPGQTYQAVTRRCVARMPGCGSEWSELNSVRRNLAGTKGRGTPVDVSHTIVVSDVGSVTALKMREEGEDWRLRSSGSSC